MAATEYRYYVERSPGGEVSSLMRVLQGEAVAHGGEAYLEGGWVTVEDEAIAFADGDSLLDGAEQVDPDEVAHLMRELDLRDELRAARHEAVDPDEMAHRLREFQPPSRPE